MPPPNLFISVSHNFTTQKFVIKENLSKMCVLSFSFDWGLKLKQINEMLHNTLLVPFERLIFFSFNYQG